MYLEKIKLRLKSLGYEVVESDEFALNFIMGKVDQHIKHFCNINEVPECLEYVFIDMCCGELLQTKQASGQLDVEPIVKKIQDGDTTVEYSSTVDSMSVFNQLVEKLLNGYTNDLIAHRCIVW